MTKKILFLGQVAPPVTGEAMVNERVIRLLNEENFFVSALNTSTINAADEVGKFKFFKVIKQIRIYMSILIRFPKADLVYIVPGQTFLGLLRLLPLIVIFKIFKKKMLAHWHGYGVKVQFEKFPYLTTFVLKSFHKQIFLTHDLKNFLEGKVQGISSSEVVTNYSSVKPQLRHKNSAHGRRLNVLFLGSLVNEKGVLEFFECAKRLRNLNFHLCGNGSQENVTIAEGLAGSLDNFFYYGVVGGEQKRNILKCSDVFVLQTSYATEGVPLSMLEAMSFGCAILTTKHNGIPEAAGDAAIYLKPSSVEDLCKNLIYLDGCREDLINMKNKSFDRSNLFLPGVFDKRIISIFKENLDEISFV